MKYGYARVSTKQQNLTLQVQALLDYGVQPENIFTDKLTGTNMDRQSLKDLLNIVKEGDIIIVKKLDRLGRSVSQVTGLIDELTQKGVFIKSIDDNVDTSNDSPMAKAMMQLLAMFSEMERNFIVERTRPAIEHAKAKGVKFGRPKANKGIYEVAVQEYLKGGVTVKELIKRYGKDSNGKDLITEATLFRRIREYKKKMEEQQ
ncbi:recombinase family protein [Bacillus amyloliquefaciens]|uniref:recombinase family protein n=1 Tax=Bacillus amyloliquefaciens TaxID=1390 RepID=UPI0005EF1DDD|nr:recombinase family protein [Bacillus amyloliquefaciens]